jgi:putative tryptophan/tyrosine transport system substrate-binding protein
MRRFLFFLAAAWLMSMTLVLPAAAEERLWVALAEEGGPYAEVAAELQQQLGGSLEVRVGRWQTLLEGRELPPDLLVTVGVAALDGFLDKSPTLGEAWSRVPLLATLIPQVVLDARQASPNLGKHPFSAVVLDQPLERVMALLKRAFPDRPRVGIVPGPYLQPRLDALQKTAAVQRLTLVIGPGVTTPDTIYPSLKTVLEESDLVLALPEPTVYNGTTLQHILLTSYRARLPLVAYSAAAVKAGAVLALYSTPTQIARRAIEMIQTWRAGRGLPPPQWPREFTVGSNAKVASSLGLTFDDPAQIEADLRRGEDAIKVRR